MKKAMLFLRISQPEYNRDLYKKWKIIYEFTNLFSQNGAY